MMDAETLTIAEIRELCNLVIDEWKVEAEKNCRNHDEKEIRALEKVLTITLHRPIRRTTRTEPPLLWKFCPPGGIDVCLGLICFVVKLVINLFAMVVLRVDHRFLNFRYEKQPIRESQLLDCLGAPWIEIGEYERYGGVLLKDGPTLHFLKVLSGETEMLERVRKKIMTDEYAARKLYGWFQDIAYRDEPFWTHLYFRLHELGVPAIYTKESQERMLSIFRKDDPWQENSIKRAMNAWFKDDRAVLEEVKFSTIDIAAEHEREQLDQLPGRKQKKSTFEAFWESAMLPPGSPGNPPSDDRSSDW